MADPGQGSTGDPLGPFPLPTSTTGWTTFKTITTAHCACTTTSAGPIIITTTTLTSSTKSTAAAAVTQWVHHEDDGLAPGVIGGIVIGAFFGFLLLVLLLICCFRILTGGGGQDSDSDTSSHHSRRRRRKRIVPIDPYPDRPDANLTFLGGGNQRDTKVVITRTQRYFVRPQPAVLREERTVRTKQTRRERVVIVGD